MGTKAAVAHPGFPPAHEAAPAHERADTREDRRLASVGRAVELLHVLDRALACTDDAELRRLAADARVGERTLEEWARHVEAFRASKQLFESGILPGPPGPRRRALDERPPSAPDARGRAYDTSVPVRLFWEALAFMVGFVLSLLVT